MTYWVGVPALNLQKRLQILEMYLDNGTLAPEDRSFFSMQLAHPKTHPVPGALGLQVLQAQLIEVRTSQEQLLHNLTRNPGTTTPASVCWG